MGTIPSSRRPAFCPRAGSGRLLARSWAIAYRDDPDPPRMHATSLHRHYDTIVESDLPSFYTAFPTIAQRPHR